MQIHPLLLKDPIMRTAVAWLVTHKNCHTVLLFGSHARGDATKNSDYDLVGIKSNGPHERIGKKKNGAFLDIHIFNTAHLRRLDNSYQFLADAILVHSQSRYGQNLIKRLRALIQTKPKRPTKQEQQFEILWIEKMLERAAAADLEGYYRRYWLLHELPAIYFKHRGLLYQGSKQAFRWLEQNDIATHQAFIKAYKKPESLVVLRHLVTRVVSSTKPKTG